MKKQDGFTLIELIIVMAIGVVLSTGSFLTYSNYKERKDLEFAVDEVFSVVKSAQNRSVVQEGGSGWGVRFNSSSTGEDGYELFKGSTYSSSTVETSKKFRRSVKFSEPSGGRTYDMIFDSRTGKLNERKIITLTHENENDQAGDVLVNSLGRVTRRMVDDVVGYWHFDEGVGTSTLDASGEGNDGELMNGVSWLSGNDCKSGGCLDFDVDVSKQFVEVNDSDSLDSYNELTLFAWIYPVGSGGSGNRGTIILGSSAYYLSYNDSNSALDCYWYGTNPAGYHSTPDGSISLNEWSQVSCVWDGSMISQYINGELVSTTTVSGSGREAGNVVIGAENSDRQFEGKIDEVRVYNTVLSSSTIQAHYDDLK